MVLKVALGGPCLEEKSYTISVILSSILGYECEFLQPLRDGLCRLIFPRGYTLDLCDGFFEKHAASYRDPAAMPGSPIRFRHPLAPAEDMVVLYGSPEIVETSGTTTIKADIIASAFFLLSRWEETIIEERDRWGRVPDDRQYLRRHGLAARPLVDEYARWIESLAVDHGEERPPRPQHFRIVPTHDIDRLYLMEPGDSLKANLAHRMPKRLVTDLLYRLLGIDQRSTFDRIMTLSERSGLQSTFFAMSGGDFPYDRYYDIADDKVMRLLREIEARGHKVGFHPSFGAARDHEAWGKEKERLEALLGHRVADTRQHYLRVDALRSPGLWSANGMAYDYSFGFSRGNGFRCGTGSEFPLFDLVRRKRTETMERPLIIMDVAIRKGKQRESDKGDAMKAIATCRRYEMPCTVLFHNHILDPMPWNDLGDFYEGMLGGSIRRRG